MFQIIGIKESILIEFHNITTHRRTPTITTATDMLTLILFGQFGQNNILFLPQLTHIIPYSPPQLILLPLTFNKWVNIIRTILTFKYFTITATFHE